MSTTIVGIFNSRQQADDALYSLRNQLATKNVSIILRNEELDSSNSGTTGNNSMSGMSGMSDMSNMGGMSGMPGMGSMSGMSSMGSISGMSGMAPMPMSLLNELSQDVMRLGGTVGAITGRLATAALSAGLTLPALAFAPLLQNATNAMNKSSAAMSSGSISDSKGCGNSWQSSEQSGKVMITIQSDEHLSQATDIMLEHGAEEINTYTT